MVVSFERGKEGSFIGVDATKTRGEIARRIIPPLHISRLCWLAVKSVSEVSAVDFEPPEMRRINQASFDRRALSHQVTIYGLGFESESDYGTC